MTELSQVPLRVAHERPHSPRTTHPELGTCWQDSCTRRLGWKLLRGPIPEGKELHHRCGVYACWNPDHLQIVQSLSADP